MAHGHVRSHGFRRRRIDGRCNRATVRTLRIEPMRSCPRELHTRNVSSVKGTQDGSCITALDYEGDISIFAIENGSNCLVRPFSHQFPGRRYATSIFWFQRQRRFPCRRLERERGRHRCCRRKEWKLSVIVTLFSSRRTHLQVQRYCRGRSLVTDVSSSVVSKSIRGIDTWTPSRHTRPKMKN